MISYFSETIHFVRPSFFFSFFLNDIFFHEKFRSFIKIPLIKKTMPISNPRLEDLLLSSCFKGSRDTEGGEPQLSPVVFLAFKLRFVQIFNWYSPKVSSWNNPCLKKVYDFLFYFSRNFFNKSELQSDKERSKNTTKVKLDKFYLKSIIIIIWITRV